MVDMGNYGKISDLLHAGIKRCPAPKLELLGTCVPEERAILYQVHRIQQRRVVKRAHD